MTINNTAGECRECEAPIAAGTGLSCSIEIFWMGEAAAGQFCDENCSTAWSERRAEDMFREQLSPPA